MKSILTNLGSRAFAQSIVLQRPISFSKFRIGSTIRFTPSPSATDVDRFVYEGPAQQISVSFGGNDGIVNIEILLDNTIGNFDVGNVMVFDQNENPFCFGVRDAIIPKFRASADNLGTELSLQLPVRILTDEFPATVYTNVQKESSVPVSPTEESLVLINSTLAEFPTYLIENFKGTGIPAILHAGTTENRWFANPFFHDVASPDFNVISGGRVGDRYTRPLGEVNFGGSFGDRRNIVGQISGGNFEDNRNINIVGDRVFGQE